MPETCCKSGWFLSSQTSHLTNSTTIVSYMAVKIVIAALLCQEIDLANWLASTSSNSSLHKYNSYLLLHGSKILVVALLVCQENAAYLAGSLSSDSPPPHMCSHCALMNGSNKIVIPSLTCQEFEQKFGSRLALWGWLSGGHILKVCELLLVKITWTLASSLQMEPPQ